MTTAKLRGTSPSRVVGGSVDRARRSPNASTSLSVFERAGDFDIIHNGFDFLPLTYSGLVDTPVVTTIHGFSSPRIVPVYERYDATTTLRGDQRRRPPPRLHYAATIHHGIDTDAFAVDPAPGEHLLSSGGSIPTRAPPMPSTSPTEPVAGSTSPASSRTRTTSVDAVEPHIDGEHVRYLGPIDASLRVSILGEAHALLHLIDFDEPFGYSVVEAMACGTPVIAYARGSMPEIIDDRKTGFLVSDVAGAVDAVDAAAGLDRNAIRSTTIERFDVLRMVDDYVAVYRAILAARE